MWLLLIIIGLDLARNQSCDDLSMNPVSFLPILSNVIIIIASYPSYMSYRQKWCAKWNKLLTIMATTVNNNNQKHSIYFQSKGAQLKLCTSVI